MLLHVPEVLSADHVARARQVLDGADWVDGRVTAGPQSSRAKQNLQLPENSPAARELGDLILAALQRSPLFMSAALPLKVFPPLFNRYGGGHSFGSHVDNAIRQVPGSPHRVRTDLSATLFLAASRRAMRAASWSSPTPMARTRSSSRRATWCCIRRRACITSPLSRAASASPRSSGFRAWFATTGSARCCSTWTRQSSSWPRDAPDHPSTVQLTGVYHNLLRQWAEL